MTSECVMLRCQVTMSSLSLEKKSRRTSESGKMAPTISDQVMMRPRFIGCEANISSPRKIAFPINAPAMPWVIVSIVRVYAMRSGRDMLADEQQRICFVNDFADAARGGAVAIESGDGGLRRFWRDSDQQAAGGLGIEEEVAIFLRNALRETHAIANEIAVIFQSAGKKSRARSFDSAGKIGKSRMLDLERDRRDIARRIPERHLARVA